MRDYATHPGLGEPTVPTIWSVAEAAVAPPPNRPAGALWVPPDERPVPTSQDPIQIRRGRDWYPNKEPVAELPSRSTVVNAVYRAPRRFGGKDHIERRQANVDEHMGQLWDFWLRQTVQKQSHAFICSRRQMIKHIFPELRGTRLGIDELERMKGRSLSNWINHLQSTGYVWAQGLVDDTGAWRGTRVELFETPQLDASGAWHSHC